MRHLAAALSLLCAAPAATLLVGLGANIGAFAAETGRPLLLVVSKSEGRLAFVDAMTLQLEAWVPTGEMPHEVAASADGRLAFVTNYGTPERPGQTISVIDIAARRELRRVDLGSLTRPHGIAVSAGKVYFTAEGAQAVGRLDPQTDQVDWIVKAGQTGTHMLVVTPDGTKLYATNVGSDTVSAIEIGSGRVTQIAVGKEPEGLDLSPDGRELWVGQNGDGQVSIINTISEQVKQTIPVGQVPMRVKFTPDGKQVLISAMDAGEVHLFDAATRHRIGSLSVGAAPVGILAAPDGKRAFVAATAANQIVVLDLEKPAVAGRLGVGVQPDGMAWVPGTAG